MADKRVKIIYEAVDNATATGRRVRDELKQHAKEASGAAAQINKMEVAGQLLGRALGMIGFGKIIRDTVNLTVELERLEQQASRTRTMFERLSGENADKGLRALQIATQGSIDNLTLMGSASKFLSMHLADSNAEAAQLLRLTTQLGAMMGMNAQDAINQMLPMLANQSYLRLDFFGLSGDRVKELADGFKKTGMQSGQAFKEAFIREAEATLARVGEIQATEAEKQAAAWQNLKLAAAQAQASGPFGQVMDTGGSKLTEAINGIAKYLATIGAGRSLLAEFQAEIRRMREEGALTDEQFYALNQGVSDLGMGAAWGTKSVSELRGVLEELKITTPGVTDAFAAWESRIHGVDSAISSLLVKQEMLDMRAYAEQVNAVNEAYEERIKKMRAQSAYADRYTGQAVAAGLTPMPYAETKGIADAQFQYKLALADTNEQIALWQQKLAGVTEGSVEYYNILTKIINLQNSLVQNGTALADAQFQYALAQAGDSGQIALWQQKLAGVTEGSVEYYNILTTITNLEKNMAQSGAALTKQRAQEWRSLVESVLQPTSVTDLDMARTRLGEYAGNEQWDEYVRRLRSAATDAKSAWKDMIPEDVLARGKDAVKVWVAEQERLFYSGQLRAEDWTQGGINWDAVMADIQRKVQEKAGREALVDEAVRRAQAAGIGISRGDVAAALGVQDSVGTGQNAAQQMAQGVQQVNIAATLTAAFEEQLNKQGDQWRNFGVLTVSLMAEGAKAGAGLFARDLAMAVYPFLARFFVGQGARP